jgi:carboxypeptidase Q
MIFRFFAKSKINNVMTKIDRSIILTLFVCFTLSQTHAQTGKSDEDALFIKQIFDKSLTEKQAHRFLRSLCFDVGNRLSGSAGAESAVRWGKMTLDTLGLDSVWLQPCMVPHWVRGEKEVVRAIPASGGASKTLNALALGNSVGSGSAGVQGDVVEVRNFEELEKIGAEKVRGKIVFFNRPLDPTQLNTFRAYGGAVDQRVFGASRAAKFGAIGMVVRSMASDLNDWPHTGTLFYDTTISSIKIPAIAISTNDAEWLSKQLKSGKPQQIYLRTTCETLPDAPSFNVIGEIRGLERPNEIFTIGGHLDSWDVGQGANDDGTGCVQSMDVVFLLKKLGYRPRHTIRCVLFMNEENGGRGGEAYAKEAVRKGEKHLAAIESDAGGFRPLGFGFEAEKDVFQGYFDKMKLHEDLFSSYSIQFNKGGGGSDIGPLKAQKTLLIGLQPDSQRYFDVHHTNNDVFENVHPRELAIGSAAMTSLIFLLDKYGL